MYSIKRISLLCFFTGLTLFVQGTAMLNTEDFSKGAISMAQLEPACSVSKEEFKNARRDEKKIARAEKFRTRLAKAFHSKKALRSLGNISDPVDKWFWIWTISWGVGILITLSAGAAIAASAIGIIWLLAFTVGAASLFIWLIKKFR